MIKKSVQLRIYLNFIAVLTVAVFATGISTYIFSRKILYEKVYDSFHDTISYISINTESTLERIEQISDLIYVNEKVRGVLENTYTDQELYFKLSDVSDQFDNFSVDPLFAFIRSVVVYGNNGQEVNYGEDVYWVDDSLIKASSYYKKVENMRGRILWSGVNDGSYRFNFKGSPVIALYRSITDTHSQGSTGVLYMGISTRLFRGVLDRMEFSNLSTILIIDNNNHVVFSTDEKWYEEPLDFINRDIGKEGYFTVKLDGEKHFIAFNEVEKYDWKVLGVIPMGTLVKEYKYLPILTLAILSLGIIISIAVLYPIFSRIFKPIKELSLVMQRVNQDETYVKVDVNGEDEIAVLGESFNDMIEKLHVLFGRVLSEEMKKKELEYKLLQAQINPHFVSNTLNAIRWMAIIQKVDNIKLAIDAFGSLLTNVSKSWKEFVTIAEELKTLEDYIYIEKLRYGDKFQVSYDIEKGIDSYQCLKFILQPIVENAIFHGIEPKEDKGSIEIKIFSNESAIIFQVMDDGIGFGSTSIDDIYVRRERPSSGFSGIGIRNIDERIKMVYGEEYGLRILNDKAGQTCIELRIQKQKRGEEVGSNV